MKAILFLSSAKEMVEGREHSHIILKPQTEKILSRLQQLSLSELQDMYHSSSDIARENQNRLQHFSERLSGKALDIYRGVVFKHMQLEELSAQERKNLEEHSVILSALYGPIWGGDEIKPYRLDFNMKLRVDEKTLKQIWKPVCSQLLSEYTVFNLASSEFSACLDRKKLHVVDVEFYVDVEMTKKPPSATMKKLRGQLIHALAKEFHFNSDSFAKVNLPQYQLRQVTDKKVVYIKTETR